MTLPANSNCYFQPCAICISGITEAVSLSRHQTPFSVLLAILRLLDEVDLVMELLVGLIAKCNNDTVKGISG